MSMLQVKGERHRANLRWSNCPGTQLQLNQPAHQPVWGKEVRSDQKAGTSSPGAKRLRAKEERAAGDTR